ncbi:MAG: heparin lyase I family protein [Planctomycetota bacterium]
MQFLKTIAIPSPNLFHVKWSPDNDGVIRVWKDGKKVFDQAGANVYGTIGIQYTPYLKFGIYHPSWKDSPLIADPKQVQHRTVYITDVVVGNEQSTLRLHQE